MKVMITGKDNKKVFELSKALLLSAKVFAEREKYTVDFDSKELGIMFNILSELLMDLIETREACEFEARVTSLLSSCIYGRFRCEGIINGRPHCPREVAMGGCDACRLMQARLAVEQEMENNTN